jgi:hypothetical protein
MVDRALSPHKVILRLRLENTHTQIFVAQQLG